MGNGLNSCVACDNVQRREKEAILYEENSDMKKVHRTVDTDFLARTSDLKQEDIEVTNGQLSIIKYQNIEIVNFEQNQSTGASPYRF